MSNSKFLTEIDSIFSTEKTRSIAKEVGGIKQSTDLTNKSIKQILKEILQPYRPPDISFSINGNSKSSNLLEKTGSSLVFNLKAINIIITTWSNPIQTIKLEYIINDISSSINLGEIPKIDDNYMITINNNKQVVIKIDDTKDNELQNIKFKLTVNDGESNYIKEITYNYIKPYYYATLDEDELFNINNISNYKKVVNNFPSYASSLPSQKIIYERNESISQYAIIVLSSSYFEENNYKLMAKDPNGFVQQWTPVLNDNGLNIHTVNSGGALLKYCVFRSDISKIDNVYYNIYIDKIS